MLGKSKWQGWRRLLVWGGLFTCCTLGGAISRSAVAGGGFVDINIYPYLSDVKTDNLVTVNIAAKLGGRFSYFSLNNMASAEGRKSFSDLNRYYSEQNIRWQISTHSPLDLTLQMNFRSGANNDRHRLGLRWRLNDSPGLKAAFEKIHLSYSINLHAIQFDHESPHVWQMEHVFRLLFPYLSPRLYLAGFIDHTFNQNLPASMPTNPVVGEAQLGYRVFDNFYVVSEYRVNEYRRSDVNNLSAGIEYKVSW
ncbi:hypothetical protein A9Q89_06615 [Gammaproteobacteria bacterium 53_120_T64]|nr:hypothetical protein A9Q89_06615 [Gammaproteobacteria bacterium 53_120_T64]